MRDLHKDFDTFSRALVRSNDVDPVYPFIKGLLKHKNYQPEWFVFVYVSFYSLESAIKVCDEFPTVADFMRDNRRFIEMRTSREVTKFGHERRGTCRNVGNQVTTFKRINSFLNSIKSLKSVDNNAFRAAVQELPYHGGWASFKIAEIFEKSLGWNNLAIPDLGLDGRDPNSNDGPVGGLRWLFGRDHKYDKGMFKHWNRFGFKLAEAWGFDIGEVETCLCKFHKIMKGKYFVGHDIQEFVELKHALGDEVYNKIMTANFNPEFWDGVSELQKSKKSVYKKTGKVLYNKYGSNVKSVSVSDIILSL